MEELEQIFPWIVALATSVTLLVNVYVNWRKNINRLLKDDQETLRQGRQLSRQEQEQTFLSQQYQEFISTMRKEIDGLRKTSISQTQKLFQAEQKLGVLERSHANCERERAELIVRVAKLEERERVGKLEAKE